MEMFVIILVVMVLFECTFVKTEQIAYFKYMQLVYISHISVSLKKNECLKKRSALVPIYY